MSEFADLVDAHYQALFRFGMSLTRDVNHASDLVQETFCIWAAKGDQLRDRSKVIFSARATARLLRVISPTR